MSCLICRKQLDDYTPLCADHAPAWGKCLRINGMAIFAGELGILDAVITRLFFRQRLVRWWLGSDVWLLWAFPYGRGKFTVMRTRIKHFITKFFVDENWFDSERLLREYTGKFGMRRCTEKHHIRGMFCNKIEKIPHDGALNVAFYWPKNCSDYQCELYGINLIQQLVAFYQQVNWIALDGSRDMRKIYPMLDAYIRPTRHDGGSRLIRECRLNEIPFYWSEDGKPDLDAMCKFVEKIMTMKDSAKPSI